MHRTTRSTGDNASVGSFRRLRWLPSALFLAALAFMAVAFVELTSPVHTVHATLAIAAAGVLWITGEAVSR